MTRRIAWDIETAPNLAAVWGFWKQNVGQHMVSQHSYVLCWSALDVDTGEWFWDSIHLHKEQFRKDPTNDRYILQSLHQLLDETDIAISHNGIGFDHKVVNTRLIKHNLKPHSPTTMIDTLSIAKARFRFPSNRLNELAKYLGIGEKEEINWTDWEGCLAGKVSSFNRMLKYNKKDVELLAEVWKRMRAWDSKSNYNTAIGKPENCPQCGSDRLIKRGICHTKTQQYQRFVCKDCHSWSRYSSNANNPKAVKVQGIS